MQANGTQPALTYAIRDPEAFARNLALTLQEAGKAATEYLKPRESGKPALDFGDQLVDIVRTLTRVGEYWLAEPQRTLEAQNRLYAQYTGLWTNALQRMMGLTVAPIVVPDASDKRFTDPEWSSNLFFDFLKQFYLITARWAASLVDDAHGLDDHTRQKASFYVRQIANAVAPSNFAFTNPEVVRETLAENGDNLVRGMKMLAEDIKAGHGELKIRQTDDSKFKLGVNIATTPGKVIHENGLCQLIQYAPATKTVLKRPLLIIPPWINKFYILDLNPEKSFVRWCVEQGHTVFVVSWVNPDAQQAKKTFADYMREGIFESLDVIAKRTGVKEVNAAGYCVGGTLLSAALATMAAKRDTRIKTATLFATQVDFTYAGDLKVFVDEEQLASLEKEMSVRGYLEAGEMTASFNMLRSNDLIWPYVISNYFKGKEPPPFDLLHWNADATRLPAANHAFYLRSCYLDNLLAKGQMELAGTKLDLKKVKIPIFNLATRDDHIAPARSVFYGSQFFGGKVTFVLTGSGHIAGVINPPSRKKYGYWTGPAPKGDGFASWQKKAKEHEGSWWPHWQAWIEAQDKRRVKARPLGRGIEPAPGRYVRVKS
ncbi:MAG TPA: class I poly(R)-hydroxyalkanoic acid synthase [Hyphomonadaceae bacterium]|nr:class I poly(R)-hydroxyalkanoic acid synthase [Hyphomonadaceae bacterium]